VELPIRKGFADRFAGQTGTHAAAHLQQLHVFRRASAQSRVLPRVSPGVEARVLSDLGDRFFFVPLFGSGVAVVDAIDDLRRQVFDEVFVAIDEVVFGFLGGGDVSEAFLGPLFDDAVRALQFGDFACVDAVQGVFVDPNDGFTFLAVFDVFLVVGDQSVFDAFV